MSSNTKYINRRGRKLTKKEAWIVLLPVLAAIVVVAVSMFTVEESSTYRFKDSGTQYYAGSAARVAKGIECRLSEEGEGLFPGADQSTGLPVYLDSSNTVVLMSPMIYYMPRTQKEGQVTTFTEINCPAKGSLRFTKGKDTVRPDSGFLYDGKDFYLFLEPMIVSYKGFEIELPALSYAEVINGGTIMLFDYNTKEFTMETLEGSVKAAPLYGEYTISLLGDSMTDYMDELTLLMTEPGMVEPLE